MTEVRTIPNEGVEETPEQNQGKGKRTSKSEHSAPAKRKLGRVHLFGIVLGVAMLGILGARYWAFASSHVSTDNAYLTNDVIQISPQVSGTVKKVLVKENQEVKAGDLIVVLDDATYKAAVAQKQADLDAAIAQAKGAGVSVALTTETGSAQMTQAEGVLGQAESGVAGAQADVLKAQAAIQNSIAIAGSSDANIKTAKAALAAAVANKKRSADAVNSQQALLVAAKASVRAAQAVYDKAARDSERYQTLLQKGAISKQAFDAAESASLSAKAQLENAQALVVQKEADLNGARQQLDVSDATIDQAKAQYAAAVEQAQASRAGIKQTQAQELIARQSVAQAIARKQQAVGQLNQARTTPRQVSVSQSAQAQAKAKVEQAKAALDAAKLQLSYTRIYAPVNGRVSKKTVEVGALVQTGTPLMAILPGDTVWVVANFKETQMAGMHAGSPCEIEVDALPGKTFEAHVDSVSAATGSTFALLPPDNATGNFVKVVQRVPVKIVFEPGQHDMDLLRSGMSVTATVKIK